MMKQESHDFRRGSVNMVTRQDIQATCDDIVREFAPLQIVLFGSYAYGTPREYSDVDLLVVMPGSKSETRKRERDLWAYSAPLSYEFARAFA